MIRAAMRAAEGGPPPPDLTKYLKWKSWGVLPKLGGTDDQRAGELERMLAVGNAFELWRAYKKKRVKLNKMTPEQLLSLKKLKDINGSV